MIRDMLLKAASQLGSLMAPAASRAALHSEIVHDARNRAAVAHADLELAVRRARKSVIASTSHADIDRQVAEMAEAKARIETLVQDHVDDPDDGLLSGMDRSLRKGDRR